MRFAKIILFYILTALAAVYARFAQMRYLTEERSGFFTADSKTAAYSLTGFMLAAVAVCVFISLMKRRTPVKAPSGGAVLSVGTATLAIGILYDVFAVEYITNAAVFVLLARICGLASVVVLSAAAVQPFAAAKKLSPILWIFVPLFLMFKLISVFTVYAGISVIASNVMTVVFLCFALLFLLYVAKAENGIAEKKSIYLILPVGLASSIVAMCCFIPQTVLFIIGRGSLVHDDPCGMPLAAAYAVFACIYTFSLYSRKNLIHTQPHTKPLETERAYDDLRGDFYSGDHD